ncbi:NADAR family protein [Mesorhizobium sp. M0578]|uniref:NADAR family protein n=1 Tax=unclassified Mesorhizobium TaxID=325217 RepID=UPI0033390EE6
MSNTPKCELCGEPMPAGEEMFKFHGYSGNCPRPPLPTIECHGLDTQERVCFYEQDFYVLSNFSAFTIMWEWTPLVGLVRFDTSEAVYHFLKFKANVPTAQQFQLMERIRSAPSAHDAFKLAECNKHLRRHDWDDVKVDVMRDILRAKADQHEYVRRKLLATGDRELVENSWRDDFWGWGSKRDGKNMLGKLWMEVRAELRAAISRAEGRPHV